MVQSVFRASGSVFKKTVRFHTRPIRLIRGRIDWSYPDPDQSSPKTHKLPDIDRSIVVQPGLSPGTSTLTNLFLGAHDQLPRGSPILGLLWSTTRLTSEFSWDPEPQWTDIMGLLQDRPAKIHQKVVLKSEGHPIKDLKDPKVQEIGKFAVNEHNKEAKTNLVYKSVIKGEVFLDISGTYYRLTILATNNDKYVVDVIDRPLERLRELVSFKKISV
ncbi:hypothetical protein LguiA_030434 [Lonicera macranthoides]